jgi:hypothetical protein
VTDPIADALDGFVPAFDSVRGDWQAILKAASLPLAVSSADRPVPTAPRRAWKRGSLARRAVQIAIALAILAVLTTGIAWAAGAFKQSPRALFAANPQGSMNAAIGWKGVWDQKVIPDSVEKAATVHIPKVGPVAFWYARADRGGWCGALRLSNGDWLGTEQAHFLHLGPGGRSIGLGGGTVPGCFATEKQMHKAGQGHAPTGFECVQNEIDARSIGELWQIRYGLINAPGAVKVSDLRSGKSTTVVGGRFFLLAIRHPRRHVLTMRLAAYDRAGNVVARGPGGFGC